uniref:uncharacterized protein LOC124054445 isoform X2 n=1 Tax=Scatophagus argus TaxID=75038 RepID=UPI001ED7FB82|nr:uncharacterized protein LOC124054445 isoform X2 [Scatophagus argus]
MTSPLFALCLTCLLLGKMVQTMTFLKVSSGVRQERSFVSVKTGDNLTLQCFDNGSIPARLYWYEQSLGHKPNLISSYYKYEKNAIFYDKFKDNPRFTLDTENTLGSTKNHLTITDLRLSDSATYYCVSCYTYKCEFTEDTTVSVKDSGLNIPALVHQSASETIQPGGSVTLNCTVHTGTCDEEHSVYWFKRSEESHPGLIYTHGGRKDQCERNPNTQTHSCVYNLLLKNVSDAGTYYCAVVSCGHILFGNGTKLDFKLFKIQWQNRSQSIEPQASLSSSSTANAEGYQEADDLHYAALNVNPSYRSGRQRNNTNSECVYSSLKQ